MEETNPKVNEASEASGAENSSEQNKPVETIVDNSLESARSVAENTEIVENKGG